MVFVHFGQYGGGQACIVTGHGGMETIPTQMPARAALVHLIAPAAKAGQGFAHTEEAHRAGAGDEHAAVLSTQTGRKGDEGIGRNADAFGTGQQTAEYILQNLPVAALSAGSTHVDGCQFAGQSAKIGQHLGKTLTEALFQRIKTVCVGIVTGNGALAQHLAGLVAQDHAAAGAAAVNAYQFHRLS